ncbi:MAG TPA: carboxypeptidase regulatory-like domain-containing protein [Terriglobia bacterium]|nr:carboxypeptidase regulatory-like domain-containing protein [Terriglobia bacterium]
MGSGRRIAIGLMVIFIFGAVAALASISGSISGVVKDPTGAVVPGADVTALNTQTGVRTVIRTDSAGLYNFPALPIGNYTITVDKSGFRTFRETGLILNANSALRVDAALTLGQATQTVNVSSTALHVETQNTSMGEVITGTKIVAVPLNGRSYTDLLSLQPGVVPENDADATGTLGDRPVDGTQNAGNQSVNGEREASNGFMVNGANVNEGRNNGAAIIPNLDSIAQFRILTSNFSAEYGNYDGGQVNLVTKSGTNQFHGDAFDFLRNTSFDSRNFYSPSIGTFIQNQFGGTFGGPIKRDKAFFFLDYQGTRTEQGVDTGLIPVPSAQDRQGNLSDEESALTGTVQGSYFASQLSQKLGYPVTAGEPYYTSGCMSSSQCVFPGAQIPQSVWASPVAPLMKYIPLPNVPGNFYSTAAYDQKETDDKGAGRMDVNTRFGMLSGYYFIDNSLFTTPYHNSPEFPGFTAVTPGRAQLMDLADTKTISPSAVNQFHFSYMRDANIFAEPVGGVGPTLSSLGFVTPFTTPGGIGPVVPRYQGVPLMEFNNYNFGLPDGTTGQFDNTFQWLDNFTKVIGTHSIMFGGEFHYDQINERNTYAENGVFSFDGSETGYDFADFLIGAPDSLIQSSQQFLDSRSKYMGLFAQDSWRAKPSVTVNYGLRWEFSQPWYDTQNKTETIIPGEQSQVFPGAPKGWLVPGDPGVPSTLAPTHYPNFSPRIGIAYSPTSTNGLLEKIFGGPGRTSFRMGYGVFYTSVEDLTQFIEVGDSPYGLFYVSPVPPEFASPYIDRGTGDSEGQRFPFIFPPVGSSPSHPDTTFNWASVEPIAGAPGFFHENTLPYSENYNFSLERQVGANNVLSASYVGDQGHNLIAFVSANPVNQAECLALNSSSAVLPGTATCGPFGEDTTFYPVSGPASGISVLPLGVNLAPTNNYMDEMANSNYNSLQVSLRHQSASSSFLLGYTYSKCLTNASALEVGIDPYNYKVSKSLCAFDLTHNFVASYSVLPFDGLVNRLGLGRSAIGTELLKGWQVTGITTFATGLPVGISEPDDEDLCDCGVGLPDFTLGKILNNTNPRSGQTYFNTSLFSEAPLGQMGDSNGSFFHGPGINNFDMALLKNFKINESKTLEFRVEAFNVWNHAQFGGPDGNINSSAFGLVTSAEPPRILQMALKFEF